VLAVFDTGQVEEAHGEAEWDNAVIAEAIALATRDRPTRRLVMCVRTIAAVMFVAVSGTLDGAA